MCSSTCVCWRSIASSTTLRIFSAAVLGLLLLLLCHRHLLVQREGSEALRPSAGLARRRPAGGGRASDRQRRLAQGAGLVLRGGELAAAVHERAAQRAQGRDALALLDRLVALDVALR